MIDGGYSARNLRIAKGGTPLHLLYSASRRRAQIENSSFIFNVDDMSCLRVLLCIVFPPLAVYDQGCGNIVITFILTLLGWIPGCIAALVILNSKK